MLDFLLSFSASNLHRTRRHSEISGHQWGGSILKVETLAVTVRQAYVLARDSARSIPDWHLPFNNGTVRRCRVRLYQENGYCVVTARSS